MRQAVVNMLNANTEAPEAGLDRKILPTFNHSAIIWNELRTINNHKWLAVISNVAAIHEKRFQISIVLNPLLLTAIGLRYEGRIPG